ncbi:zinc metallopeptidase [Roseimicrobium sp. ORNL1]|uniref:zinc metallopeptidase n=1 Tax=Roseimicrobium sp. ORNL1 TaxID=2711231 RepID=UPI0013E1CA33|nr:zinc metallopeptidase [Roseimicrobium sp. ORNL1]QIF02679.1 zinc metallopeptidase [Roseimicrobium sp. ORNL1]
MIWILFLGTLGLSLWASWRVKSVYRKHLQTPVANGMTGAEAAALILQRADIRDVQIFEHQEMLGDHYDPTNKRLVLSSDNYHGRSASAVGVAAHEAGHAIQHKVAYAPLHWRMAAVGVTTIASQIVMWLPILGLFTGMIKMPTMFMIMGVAWGVIMLFNLITLPVEFDATRRAKLVLNDLGIVRTQEEASAVSSVLNAAAWTYVAAFITSLAYMIWHLLPLLVGGRSSDE